MSSNRTVPLELASSSPSPALVERLEPRRFLSASLKIENLDVIPGFERLIFNRIRTPNAEKPNHVKDRGTLKLTNQGDQTLRFSAVEIQGPFKILGMPPTAVPAGKSVNVTVQFVATKLPPFTYNQTAGFDASRKGGAHVGALTFNTNDPANATVTEGLAGWYQLESEKNQEPGLQTIVNLIADYKTDIAPPGTAHLDQPDGGKKYYGEETANAYWQVLNPSRGVGVRQIASFHTQGDTVDVSWFNKSDKIARKLYTTAGLSGQTFLPFKEGQPGVPAFGSFGPGSATFGFKIQNEWSDDKLNKIRNQGQGHHVRFFQARDHFGNALEGTYFMTMDYSVVQASQNFDFQDNVFIVSNIKPAGN